MNDGIEDRLREAYTTRAEQVDAVPELDNLAARRRQASASKPPWWRRRIVVLVAAGTVAAGSLAWVGLEFWPVEPVESPFNPGGELHCSRIQTMTPTGAEAELESRGYDVEWQYEPTPGSTEWSRERPPRDADTVVLEVVIDERDSTALILAVDYDPDDPEHRRLRQGITQCNGTTGQP